MCACANWPCWQGTYILDIFTTVRGFGLECSWYTNTLFGSVRYRYHLIYLNSLMSLTGFVVSVFSLWLCLFYFLPRFVDRSDRFLLLVFLIFIYLLCVSLMPPFIGGL